MLPQTSRNRRFSPLACSVFNWCIFCFDPNAKHFQRLCIDGAFCRQFTAERHRPYRRAMSHSDRLYSEKYVEKELVLRTHIADACLLNDAI